MAQPERVRSASIQNAEQSLLRHDWIYRWKTLLELAGVRPSAGMGGRMRRLSQMASTMTATNPVAH
jgi:hypothetical protein